jgi:anti-anti-sigma regulatory factor
VLRITTKLGDDSLSLKLEGRVVGVWVELLRKTWTDAIRPHDVKKILVDLEGVGFADTEGRKLLNMMQEQGVALVNLSGFMHEVLGRNESTSNYNNWEQ